MVLVAPQDVRGGGQQLLGLTLTGLTAPAAVAKRLLHCQQTSLPPVTVQSLAGPAGGSRDLEVSTLRGLLQIHEINLDEGQVEDAGEKQVDVEELSEGGVNVGREGEEGEGEADEEDNLAVEDAEDLLAPVTETSRRLQESQKVYSVYLRRILF